MKIIYTQKQLQSCIITGGFSAVHNLYYAKTQIKECQQDMAPLF